MQKLKDSLSNFWHLIGPRNKVLLTVLGIIVLVIGLGIGVYLVGQQQKTKIKAAGLELTLSTSATNIKVGDTFTVVTTVDTKTLSISAADLRYTFNSSLLEAQSINSLGDFTPTVLVPGKITAGTAAITLGCLINETGAFPKSGVGTLSQITFKAIAAGTASIAFDPATAATATGQSTNAIGVLTPLSLTITTTGATNSPTPIATPTKTPTPTPTGSKTPTPTPTPTPTKSPTPTPTKSATSTPTGSPSGSPTTLPGDVNRDGVVNIVDIGIVIDNYNLSPLIDVKADLNGDGVVNIVDIGILIDNYGNHL